MPNPLPPGKVSLTTSSAASLPPRRKNDIFISYSRRDTAFIQRLDATFRTVQRDPWIDWEDIQEGEAWRKAITRGIEAADTFIFVISPDSVNSPECTKELEQAIQLSKRIIPIVWRDATNVHPIVAELNWIFFRESDPFDQAFQKLLKAIDTDLPHVQTHTRLLSRAIEWENGRDDGFLLRGKDLQTAEQWLIQAVGKEPPLTELQDQFITKSREVEAANERLANAGRKAKQIIGISMLISGLALIGAAIAIIMATRQANEQVSRLNQQTQQLASNINAQKNEIINLTTRQEQLTEDRNRLIGELKKFGFTDDKVKVLLTSSPTQWKYQIDQVTQANASYQETLDRLQKAETAAAPTPSPTVAPTPVPPPVAAAPMPFPSPAAVPLDPPSPSPTATKSAESERSVRSLPGSTALVQRSRPVTVTYFPRDVNAAALNRVLRRLGFTAEPRQPDLADEPTNVIFYSQDIREDAVKLVAFALIRAGVQIKAIQPLPQTDSQKSIIQVSALRELQEKPPLEVATIRRNPLPLPR